MGEALRAAQCAEEHLDDVATIAIVTSAADIPALKRQDRCKGAS